MKKTKKDLEADLENAVKEYKILKSKYDYIEGNHAFLQQAYADIKKQKELEISQLMHFQEQNRKLVEILDSLTRRELSSEGLCEAKAEERSSK